MNITTVDVAGFSDQELIHRIQNDDVEAYEQLFHQFYADLCRFSLKYVREEETSEEIVQEVFIGLWEKRQKLHIQSSLKSYMFKSVKNSAINYLKSQYMRQDFQRDFFDRADLPTDNTRELLEFDELQNIVQKAINYLPDKCRIIYNLSRNSDMTYQEIANELEISVKTVEAQMGVALKKLRNYLKVHWEALVVLFFIQIGCLTF